MLSMEESVRDCRRVLAFHVTEGTEVVDSVLRQAIQIECELSEIVLARLKDIEDARISGGGFKWSAPN